MSYFSASPICSNLVPFVRWIRFKPLSPPFYIWRDIGYELILLGAHPCLSLVIYYLQKLFCPPWRVISRSS